ncbi:MAG: 50S ribosomal protein L25 [Elusimicrobia bacterium]|nr:50S ribosomal protein L25 [Elusimicrobiota bacterium]
MEITLNVEVRAEKGTKKVLSSLRAESRIPAVVYGGEKPPINVALSEKDLMAARRKGGANAIITLKHAKGQETVIVKELQRHPVTDRPVHADFQRISLTKKIEAKVPLNIVGEAPGVKTSGGMMSIDMRELRIKALPTAIPQHIDVDVSKLELHQNIHVKDLSLPAGVEVLDSAEAAVIRIVVAKVEVVAEPVPGAVVEGAVAAEPESASTKGKKDEEGKVIEKAAAPAPAADAKKAPKKEGK